MPDGQVLGGLKRSSQHLYLEVCDGTTTGRAATRTGRPPMRSPGGRGSIDARSSRRSGGRSPGPLQRGRGVGRRRVAAGRVAVVPAGWRDATHQSRPFSGRYLSFAEREEIAMLNAQQHGVRVIARRLGRSPSTISRELRRNAVDPQRPVEYRATTRSGTRSGAPPPQGRQTRRRTTALARLRAGPAGRHDQATRTATQVAGPGRCDGSAVATGVASRPALGEGVESQSRSRNRLPVDFPDDESMRISHEAIYQALYVQGRGALRANSSPACAPGERCGCRAPAPAGAARSSSHPRS